MVKLLKNRAGFSLIEIIAVLVLVAIVSVVVVARAGGLGNAASLQADVGALKSHLRYAQMRAMSDTVPWSTVIGGSSYTLFRDGAPSPLPGGDSETYFFAGGVSATAATVTFDDWGIPAEGAVSITLSGAGGSVTVTVTENTGFVP